MAKFNLDYDTVTKQVSITMDGVAIGNVGDLCLFRTSYGNKVEYHLEFVQRTSDAENDTITYTRTMAHDQAVASLGAVQEPDVLRDIRQYFGVE